MKEIGLLADVGNSTTLVAEYDFINKKMEKRKCFATEEIEVEISKFDLQKYQKIVVASVVPAKNFLFADLAQTIFVKYSNIPILKINLDRPEQVGADRLVTALAAYQLTQTDTLIIDSGTATTICFVEKEGIYQGGIILPGMGISSKALHDYTAQIPLIWVEPITKLFGKTTEEAVRIGLYQGHINMLKGFIEEYRKKYPEIKVVGTGKGLEVLRDRLDLDIFERDLILLGLGEF